MGNMKQKSSPWDLVEENGLPPNVRLTFLICAVVKTAKMTQETHENKQTGLIACCVIMMCLSGIAVALRLILRRTSKAGLWYDDYAIIVALFFSYGLEIPVFISKKTIAHFLFSLTNF